MSIFRKEIDVKSWNDEMCATRPECLARFDPSAMEIDCVQFTHCAFLQLTIPFIPLTSIVVLLFLIPSPVRFTLQTKLCVSSFSMSSPLPFCSCLVSWYGNGRKFSTSFMRRPCHKFSSFPPCTGLCTFLCACPPVRPLPSFAPGHTIYSLLPRLFFLALHHD